MAFLRTMTGSTAYNASLLRTDLIAGAVVCALVVPQAISYAQLAGLPPAAGVLAAFAAPLAYALVGTSRQLIVSPTSATAAISASAALTLALAAGAPDVAAALAILSGALFIFLG